MAVAYTQTIHQTNRGNPSPRQPQKGSMYPVDSVPTHPPGNASLRTIPPTRAWRNWQTRGI